MTFGESWYNRSMRALFVPSLWFVLILGCTSPEAGPPVARLVSFLPDRSLLVVGANGQIQRWSAAGTQSRQVREAQPNAKTYLLPDGQRVLFVGAESATMVDGTEATTSVGIPMEHGTMIAASYAGDTLYTLTENKVIEQWQLGQRIGQVTLQQVAGETLLAAAVFSKNAQLLVTMTARDSVARLWDATTGALIKELSGHLDKIQSAAFSSDGSKVLLGSADGTASLWQKTNFSWSRVQLLTGHQKGVRSVAFSPFGLECLTGDGVGTIRVWQMEAQSFQRNVRLKETLFGHTDSIESVAFSSNGTQVASAAKDGTARMWLKSPDSFYVLPADPTCDDCILNTSASITSKGDVFVTTTDETKNNIKLWDAARLRAGVGSPLLFKFHAPDQEDPGKAVAVQAAVLSPTGKWLCSIHSIDASVRLWDVSNPQLPQQKYVFTNKDVFYNTVLFFPDESKLALVSTHKLEIFDITNPANPTALGQKNILGASVYTASLSTDGTKILTGDSAGQGNLWNVESPQNPNVVSPLLGAAASLSASAFSPGGENVLLADDRGLLHLWSVQNVQQPVQIAEWIGHPDPNGQGTLLGALQFSKDGKRFLSAGTYNVAYLWDAQKRFPVTAAHGMATRFAFSYYRTGVFVKDDTMVFLADGQSATLWEPAAPQEQFQIALP